jgi:hypothetical protein
MKLHTHQSHIERGGVQGESNFTIKTNALSFSILSSGLYTDPIMAIVRELSCNAYDAHVAANNEKTPFEIHLPNNLEPWFSIKDYGVGLSDEDIRGDLIPVMVEDSDGKMIQATTKDGKPEFTRTGGLYTTYFDSTKTNSNDFIGALGLGSKSPFSYSDAFEVISCHGGMKRTYAIFLNEEGIPTVALMGEIATDEHSGLEVKITIKSEDFHSFKERTTTALKYFPVKPKVTGALHFKFEELPKFTIETKEWMLTPLSGWHSGTFTAVQGNVAYRVDTNQLNEYLNYSTLEFLRCSNIVAFFNIGELEVSANREEIRYDKHSLETLVARMKKIHNEFSREVEKKIGKINKKYWYAAIELNELSRSLFNRSESIRNFIKPNEIKNKILKRYIENAGRVNISPLRGYELTRYTLNGYYAKSQRLKKHQVSKTFAPDAGTLWVINDVKRGGLGRLREYLNENSYNDAIVISQFEEPLKEFKDDKLVKYIGFEKEYKRLCQELGNPDIHKISEITDEPEREPTSRELTFYRYAGLVNAPRSYYDYDRISWDKVEHDINQGGLFFPLKFGSKPALVDADDVFEPLSLGNAEHMRNALEFLIGEYNKKHDTSYNLADVLGLPTATYKKAKKISGWVNIFDFALEILPKYKEEISFYNRKMNTSRVLGIKDQLSNSTFVENVKSLDDKSSFKQTLMPLINGQEKYDNDILRHAHTIERLYNKLIKISDIESEPFYDDTAFNEYPMLTLIENLGYNRDWSVLFDYIKLIDRS